MDKSKIEELISNVEGSLSELKSAISGEGEMSEDQMPDEEMETEESQMVPQKAKVMIEDEEPPPIVKRMAGMR